MKKNAQLNKYGAILLLSDLWCAYDWGDANVSYDQVLKNEWALSPQTNINNIVVDVKTKDGTFSRRTLQFNDADWKMYLEVKDTKGTEQFSHRTIVMEQLELRKMELIRISLL